MNTSLLKAELSGNLAHFFSPASGLRRLWLVALLLISIMVSGCKTESVPPAMEVPEFCGTIPVPGDGCNTYVTVQRAMCGSGIWADLWLQLDNGEYLQPWDSNIALPQHVNQGQRFRISYEVIARDNRKHPGLVCLAVPPQAETIRITCLQEEYQNTLP